MDLTLLSPSFFFFLLQNGWKKEKRETAEQKDWKMDPEKILDDYGTSLLRFAYAQLHNMADAQEIVQDTLLAYLKKAPVFENEAAQKAWLFQTAANLCRNRLRFNFRHAAQSLDVLYERSLQAEPDLSFVWQGVKKLPENYRTVIHLYYQEGYTAKEIASILQKKESTIRTWLQRAREQLKKILLEEYDFE